MYGFSGSIDARMTKPMTQAAVAAAAAAGAVGLYAAYYMLRGRSLPRVRAGPTPLNKAILAKLPSLSRYYYPPVWAFTSWGQLFLYLTHARWRPPLPLRREVLTTSDGGEVGLDWLEDAGLSPDAPILLLMHTITGSSREFRELALGASARRWRVAVCLRRGHLGAPLKSPRFNLLGSTADLEVQIRSVRSKFPNAPLLGLGSSAGTGLLVRYLGEKGEQSAFAAAVAICPGYDTGPGGAFSRFAPFFDQHVLKAVKRLFFRPCNLELLSTVPGFYYIITKHL